MAGDGTQRRELLHPDKRDISLRYSLAHAVVPVDQVSIPRALATSEVYYILAGQEDMHIDDEVCGVEPRDVGYIPPTARQFIRNTGIGPLVFICLVDPAWRQADETVFELVLVVGCHGRTPEAA